MKKFTLAIALLCAVSFAFGQRAYLDGKVMDASQATFLQAKTVTDTLAPFGVLNATGYALYPSTGGGYVCGNNGYGDAAKAQQFLVDQGYVVEGVLIWVGAKQVNGSEGTLTVTLNDMNGTATLSTGTGPGPGTVLNTVSLGMNSVDSSSSISTLATFMFTNPTTVLSDYAVVADFMAIGDDTIGIVSCEDGDAQMSELSFDRWSDNTWHSILEPNNWGLDIDMAIFPVVDMSTAGIDNGFFVNGLKMDQNFPNPAVDITEIRFELENNANVTLLISDINGRIVRQIEAGMLDAGQHNLTLDVNDLSSGTYFYSIQAGKNRLSKKMQIAH